MSASLRAFFAVLLALALDLHCAVGQEIQTDPILFEQSQAADSAFINVTANILSSVSISSLLRQACIISSQGNANDSSSNSSVAQLETSEACRAAAIDAAVKLGNQLLLNRTSVQDLFSRRIQDLTLFPVITSSPGWVVGSAQALLAAFSSQQSSVRPFLYMPPVPSNLSQARGPCGELILSPAVTTTNATPPLNQGPTGLGPVTAGNNTGNGSTTGNVTNSGSNGSPASTAAAGSSGVTSPPTRRLQQAAGDTTSSSEDQRVTQAGPGSNSPLSGGQGGGPAPSAGGASPATGGQFALSIQDESYGMYTGPLSADDGSWWEQAALGQHDAQGVPVGPVWPRTHLMLYYRADWFAALNITPPSTWDELISLGRSLAATDWFSDTVPPEQLAGVWVPSEFFRGGIIVPDLGDGLDFQTWPQAGSVSDDLLKYTPDSSVHIEQVPQPVPLCLDLGLQCKAGDLLAAIAASFIQTKGPEQGHVYDTPSAALLTNSTAYALAFKILTSLAALSLPTFNTSAMLTSCSGLNRFFTSGNCAMTIDWDVAMAYAYNEVSQQGLSETSSVIGNIGMAPLPGSTIVFDRTTQRLTSCTPSLCPSARVEPVTAYSVPAPPPNPPAEPPAPLVVEYSGSSSGGSDYYGYVPDTLNPVFGGVRRHRKQEVQLDMPPPPTSTSTSSPPPSSLSSPTSQENSSDAALQEGSSETDPQVTSGSRNTGFGTPVSPPLPPGYVNYQSPPPPPLPPLGLDIFAAAGVTVTRPGASPASPSPSNTSVVPAGYALVNRAPYSAFAGMRVSLCTGALKSDETLLAARTLVKELQLVTALQYARSGQFRAGYKAVMAPAGSNTSGPSNGSAIVPPGTPPPDVLWTNDPTWWQDMAGTNSSLTYLDPQDVRRWFTAVWQAQFWWPGNRAPQLTTTQALTNFHRQVFEEAAHASLLAAMTSPTFYSPVGAASALTKRMREVTRMGYLLDGHTYQNTSEAAAVFKAFLWRTTGYVPPAPPPPAHPAPTPEIIDFTTGGSGSLVAAIAAPICAVALVVFVALTALWYVRRSQHRSLLGHVRPPGAGPATTLLITDIQDSTCIWETVAPEVADEAIKLHHDVIRRTALAHCGYECQTEGDSFILAFHTARDAALFAVRAQVELLLVNWPRALYEVEACRPIWVQPGAQAKGPAGATALGQHLSAQEDPAESHVAPLDELHAFGVHDGPWTRLMGAMRSVISRVRSASLTRSRSPVTPSAQRSIQYRLSSHQHDHMASPARSQQQYTGSPPVLLKQGSRTSVGQQYWGEGPGSRERATTGGPVRRRDSLGNMWRGPSRRLSLGYTSPTLSHQGRRLSHPGGFSSLDAMVTQPASHSPFEWATLSQLPGFELDASGLEVDHDTVSIEVTTVEANAGLHTPLHSSPLTAPGQQHTSQDGSSSSRQPLSKAISDSMTAVRGAQYAGYSAGALKGSSKAGLPPLAPKTAGLRTPPALSKAQLSIQDPVSSVFPQSSTGFTSSHPGGVDSSSLGWQEDIVSTSAQILSLDSGPTGGMPGAGITGYSGLQLSTNPSSSGSLQESSLPSELPTAVVSAIVPQQVKQTRFGATIILGSPHTPGIADGSSSHIDSPGMGPSIHALDSATVTLSQGNAISSSQGVGLGGADASSGSYSQELLVSEQLARAAPRAPGPGPGRVLIFRGLRVRMGLASGAGPEDVQWNQALGRAKYGGALAAAAKAFEEAAQGGMVLAGTQTFMQLSVETLRSQVLVVSMGEHTLLSEGAPPSQVYNLLPPSLIYRAAHLGPVRSKAQRSMGFLQAPYGSACVCFMNVVGLQALEASLDPPVLASALQLYQRTAQAALCERGGYLLEAADGLCLAAFARPAPAVRWALDTIALCLEADWPEELLQHELGEVVALTTLVPNMLARPSVAVKGLSDQAEGPDGIDTPATSFRAPKTNGKPSLSSRFGIANASVSKSAKSFRTLQAVQVQRLLFRGLRLRVGMDYGPVRTDLHAVTGRVTYRGRVMNRAARISSVAKSGQVWLSEGAWEVAESEVNMVLQTHQEASSSQRLAQAPDNGADGGGGGSDAAHLGTALNGGGVKHEGNADSAGSTAGVRAEGTSTSTGPAAGGRHISDKLEVAVAGLGPFKLKGISEELELVHAFYQEPLPRTTFSHAQYPALHGDVDPSDIGPTEDSFVLGKQGQPYSTSAAVPAPLQSLHQRLGVTTHFGVLSSFSIAAMAKEDLHAAAFGCESGTPRGRSGGGMLSHSPSLQRYQVVGGSGVLSPSSSMGRYKELGGRSLRRASQPTEPQPESEEEGEEADLPV